MDGLECSEVQYSMLFPDNIIFRLDSEFYNSKAISVDSKLKGMTHFYLKKDEVVSGPFGSALKSDAYLTEGEIPFVRIENIRGGFDINMDYIVYISNQDNNRIKNSQLHVDDIVLSKVGNSIGFFARVDDSVGVCNISENNIGIKLAKYSTIEKHYILTYLNCRYAQMLVSRRTSGNAQPKLNVGDLCYIPIPQFTNRFYEAISKIIVQSNSLVLQSKNLYSSAETILINRFCVEQDNDPIAVKSLSESFKKAGRLDAEYYQEKYRAYETAIISAPQGHTYIKDVFIPVKEKCQRNLPSYDYVEIGDIDVSTGSAFANTVVTEELPDNAKIMTQKGDILVSTVRPNRGAVAILENNNLLVSGAFAVLRKSGDYPKEVLQVLLRTSMYRDWLLRFNVGTSYPVIKDEDVLNMPIPLLEENIRQDVVNKVNEAASLRRQSKQLLEYAKQAVEIAIEQGEDAALTWLKDKVE